MWSLEHRWSSRDFSPPHRGKWCLVPKSKMILWVLKNFGCCWSLFYMPLRCWKQDWMNFSCLLSILFPLLHDLWYCYCWPLVWTCISVMWFLILMLLAFGMALHHCCVIFRIAITRLWLWSYTSVIWSWNVLVVLVYVVECCVTVEIISRMFMVSRFFLCFGVLGWAMKHDMYFCNGLVGNCNLLRKCW